MTIVELLGMAASLSLLAGWRLYLCVLATGLAMSLGLMAPPSHVPSLAILANHWVMAAAALGLIAEFSVDKIAWLDSLWDAVHSAIRPIGGALLTLAVIDPSQPVWQVVALLLGGSGTLLAHSAKAGSRAVINASPEPFSNIAVSAGEDVVSAGLIVLIFNAPVAAAFAALLMLIGIMALLGAVRRMLGTMFTPARKNRTSDTR